MAYLYFVVPKKKTNPWPMAAVVLAGFVLLYAVGTITGLIQP